jgi:hypothetical protein
MVFSNNLLLGAVSAAADAYLIEQSLLFNDDDTAYLNRTPSTAGNRKTWTFSAWVKPSDTSSNHVIFSTSTDANNRSQLLFSSGKLQFTNVSGGSVICQKETTALFRDASAWYSITLVCSTTDNTAEDRLKLYINGVRITSFGTNTNFLLNADAEINSITTHEIGRRTQSSIIYYSGLMALPILVDGAAVAPTAFGETDNDGFWNPIEFTGATTTTDNVSVGGTASAETTFLTYVPANAFDGNTSTRWISSATPAWLEYDRGSGNGVISTSYSISCGPSGSASTSDMPKNWTIEGYNGSSWDTLATVTGEAAWSLGETRLYTFTNTTSYEKYRIDITLQQGGGAEIEVGELRFYAAGTGYGQNGFQLDFADTSDFGADVNYTGDTSVTFTDSSVNSGSATAYTFSSQAIGTASSDRVIAVGVSAGNSPAGVSTLTVGGVSAVKAIDATNSTETELWYASVPSGTTADIVVTFSSGKGRCGIGVWALTGVTGVGATNTSTSSTATLTVSGRTKDIVLAVYGGKDHTSVIFSGVTENYDEDISGAGSQYQAGGSKKLTATGSNTITVTPNTGATEVAAVSAVFLATGNNGYINNNFTASDQLEDSPTDSSDDGIGNFATWNPNDGGGHTVGVPTEGNLQFTNAAANYKGLVSTIAFPTSGKWGVKFTITGSVSGSNDGDICIVRDQFGSPTAARTRFIATTAANYTTFGLHMNGGDIKYKFNGGSSVVHYNGAASATSDVYEFLFDADNGYFDVKKNGSAFGTQLTGIPTGELYWLCADMYATGILVDFGQQGYVPSESGYSALATQNLPAPTLADGSQYFNTVLYTGTGSELAITSLDFTPDFVWIKNRDATDNHMLYDSVRGATKDLHSNTTDAETTTAQTLKSFDSAGFTLGTDVQVNTNTEDYVAWCWKAGGAASSNTDGSITTSVSANPTAGFSIISYTGNATAGATLGHGLSSAPKFIICKNRDNGANNWGGYHVSLGGTHRIFLDNNNAAQDDDGNWNDTNPTASVITLGNGGITNSNTDDFIMYAWSEVEGFSKFGSYTGNANVDGPFIYTGFKPAFILEKRTDSAGAWYITDMTRDTYNPVNKYLMPDASNAEASGSTSSGVYLDALSNGYKIRGTGAGQEYNRSGGTYIFAAFAEHPFQGADGVTQARAR